jgi:dienelactone hydrolase
MKAKRTVGQMVVALVSVIVQYLIIVVFAPGFDVPEQPIEKHRSEDEKPPEGRKDVSFFVGGVRVRGWLYRPASDRPVPCIVLSTGLGGTKDGLLERYALRFVAAGYAALTYDYRHFGASDGSPRQMMDPALQLDDLRGAVAFLRTRAEIDPDRIVLWGTSAGGSYGLLIAAEDPRIAGIITQCTPLDSEADARQFVQRMGVGHFLRLFMHAQRDKGRSRLGLPPHRIPIVGLPGTVAFLTAPGGFEGYARLVAESETFENQVCARLLFAAHAPDTVASAERVQCPVLILVCEHDNLIASGSHERVAAALGDRSTVVRYPIGHFDVYVGEWFEKAVQEKLAFLAEHVGKRHHQLSS